MTIDEVVAEIESKAALHEAHADEREKAGSALGAIHQAAVAGHYRECARLVREATPSLVLTPEEREAIHEVTAVLDVEDPTWVALSGLLKRTEGA